MAVLTAKADRLLLPIPIDEEPAAPWVGSFDLVPCHFPSWGNCSQHATNGKSEFEGLGH